LLKSYPKAEKITPKAKKSSRAGRPDLLDIFVAIMANKRITVINNRFINSPLSNLKNLFLKRNCQKAVPLNVIITFLSC